MERQHVLRRMAAMGRREAERFSRRPMLLFCIFVAPVMFLAYFTSLMGAGTPTKLPGGVVDEDDTPATRRILRALDALEGVSLERRFATFAEARRAMQQGRIHGFLLLPRGLARDLRTGRSPRVSYYYSQCYYVAAAQVSRDLRTAAGLAGREAALASLEGRGMSPEAARAALQPVTVEAHPLGNPTMDYSVFLSNMLVPGIILLLSMLAAIYAVGMEWKLGTRRRWLALAGGSPALALAGKLLPQTAVFSLMLGLAHAVFYAWLGFPCRCGLAAMAGWGVLAVAGAQGFAVALFGLMPGQMRTAMCACSLWGILSFSLAGLSFPVMAMGRVFRWLSWLEPLRHYYLLYVNQALNGYPAVHAWPHAAALAAFALLPLPLLPRYGRAMLRGRYVP